jgi:hypothetical protein
MRLDGGGVAAPPLARHEARVMFRQVEAIAGAPHVDSCWYGLRRIAADLAETDLAEMV